MSDGHKPGPTWHERDVSSDFRSDDELLAQLAPGLAGPAFAAFYERHERAVLAYFRRRVPTSEAAADLAAETFAQALVSRARYTPQPGAGAAAWLFGIAAHVLARSVRRGRIEDRARSSIGLPPLALDDVRLAAIDETGDDCGLVAALERLPPEQREAIRARILDDRAYPEVAARLNVSETVARKRVSRGLAALRRNLEGSSR
jgi:RNA polymerase sigma factor (sigma-70 family)